MALTDPVAARTSRTRTRLLAAIALLVTFACGLVLGAAGDRVFLFHHRRLMPPAGVMNFAARHLADRLDRELHLSPAQRGRIEQILERRRARIAVIWAGVHPQVRSEVEATNVEIEAVLTPAQRPRYEQLRMRFERHARGLIEGDPPPPPPPGR